jgi:hypothetical protein
MEKEYMEMILFAIASKKIKYLGVNLTKDVNYLYKENYKPPKKEIKEDTEDGNISCAHRLKNQHSKNGYTTKSNLHLKSIPIKIPMTFFTE